MKKMHKIAVVAMLTVSAFSAAAPAAAKVNEYEGQHRSVANHSFLGDPSQWGIEKVNEYEGQHHTAPANVEGDPSQWGVAGDPSQWGIEKVNEYEGQHRSVANDVLGDPSQWLK